MDLTLRLLMEMLCAALPPELDVTCSFFQHRRITYCTACMWSCKEGLRLLTDLNLRGSMP